MRVSFSLYAISTFVVLAAEGLQNEVEDALLSQLLSANGGLAGSSVVFAGEVASKETLNTVPLIQCGDSRSLDDGIKAAQLFSTSITVVSNAKFLNGEKIAKTLNTVTKKFYGRYIVVFQRGNEAPDWSVFKNENVLVVRRSIGDDLYLLSLSCAGTTQFQDYNIWTQDSGLHLNMSDFSSSCAGVLSSSRLVGALIGTYPFLYKGPNGTAVGGSNIDIYGLLSKSLGFEVALKTERGFGSRNKTTNAFSGMMGTLTRGQADFSLALGTWERFYYAGISSPVYHNFFLYITGGRRRVTNLWTSLRPFSTEVWIGLGIFFFTAVGTLNIFKSWYGALRAEERFSLLYFYEHGSEEDSGGQQGKFFLYVAGGIVEQTINLQSGSALPTRSPPIRLFVALFLLCAFVLTLSFKGNLLASLVSISYEKPIDTSQNVLDSGLPVYAMGGGAINAFYRNTRDPMYKAVRQRIEDSEGFFAPKFGVPQEVVKMVSRNEAVLMHQKVFGQTFSLRPSREVVLEAAQTLLFTPGFIWKEEFNMAIMRMHAGGIISHMVSRNNKIRRLISEPEDLVVFSLGHILTPMIIFGSGFCLACLVLVFEVLRGKCGEVERRLDPY